MLHKFNSDAIQMLVALVNFTGSNNIPMPYSFCYRTTEVRDKFAGRTMRINFPLFGFRNRVNE
jgi:hypothetical protein